MELKSQLIEYAIPEEKVSRLHNASYHHQKPSFGSFMYFTKTEYHCFEALFLSNFNALIRSGIIH